MAKVIIFGVLDTASLAHYYLQNDSAHEVVAFCVTKEYLPEDPVFESLPVVALENVQKDYPPSEFSFFVPMTGKKMNKLRESIYNQVKELGYQCISYISSKATIFDNVEVGDNCFILEDNTLQPYVKIGNNVVLWSGNHIGHHSVIKDHIFFTSHVVLSGHCIVEPYCFFGVNSTVVDQASIAEGTFVAMAANINKSTEPWGVYKGNPALKSKIPSNKLRL